MRDVLSSAKRLDPGCYREDYLVCLYRYVARLPKPCRVLEVGCYHGQSTLLMAAAMKGSDSQLITVDPIFRTGIYHAPDVNKSGIFYQADLSRLYEEIALLKLDGYITVIPDHSWNLLNRWDGRLFDLIFIDGEHTYKAVKKDCGWMQFVKPGGFAVFDDWIDKVELAVQEYIQNHDGWTILHESTSLPNDFMVLTLLQKCAS